ncbi:MAG: efflux RND transporter periplasmic adaptor subunit [Thermoguttaceae bacterium]|nr:efflux RND transporter periplasmic adaptor subunit [Thermoguttaceae bacterium]
MKSMKIGSFLLTLIILAALRAQAQPGGGPATAVPNVITAPSVEMGELDVRRFPGPIVAVEEVDIVPRVTGYIEKINFKEGDFVEAGDLLFEIEQREYAATLKRAEAEVASRQSAIVQAEAAIKQQEARIEELNSILEYREATYNRNKQLFARGTAVSQDDVDNTESAFKATRAQLAAAEATLASVKSQFETAKSALAAAEAAADLAAFDMEHTRITAPISGKIGKVTVTPGNLVTPQFGKMVDIKTISPIYVRFAISEQLFLTTYGGEKGIRDIARIRLELADGTMYGEEAEIALIDNKVDPKTNKIMIWATLQNEDHKLLPGSYATVYLSPKSENPTCAVIASAVQTVAGGGNFVYVLDGENKVERREVRLGALSEKYYEITSGIKPGETVVIEGMNKVQPGQQVNPIPAEKDEL